MKNVPVIKDGNVREIYRALSKSAKLLLGEERFLKVIDGAIEPDTGSFDVSSMARTLNHELEDLAAARIANNYVVKKEAPENRPVRNFDDVSDERFIDSITGRNIRPDNNPNALKSFDGVSDEAFIRALTNPTVGHR